MPRRADTLKRYECLDMRYEEIVYGWAEELTMGDGRKWAAEQDELEAERRAEEHMADRVRKFMHAIGDSTIAARDHLQNNDKIKKILAELNLSKVPMTADQHDAAAELDRYVRRLP